MVGTGAEAGLGHRYIHEHESDERPYAGKRMPPVVECLSLCRATPGCDGITIDRWARGGALSCGGHVNRTAKLPALVSEGGPGARRRCLSCYLRGGVDMARCKRDKRFDSWADLALP